ncbi:hypothetical protein [Bradyrhizobium diazoefficiens]|nr:hypothetical protein XF16B_46080 [Bradyrhizobium diazoefficiens]BCF70261.1 hypothetical protein XF19B_46140 [Bradyrhizobium diazoefficiens]
MSYSAKILGWYLVCMVLAAAAWINHVVTCLNDGRTLLLIAGAIAWPVGVIHGWGIWFGFWP